MRETYYDVRHHAKDNLVLSLLKNLRISNGVLNLTFLYASLIYQPNRSTTAEPRTGFVYTNPSRINFVATISG